MAEAGRYREVVPVPQALECLLSAMAGAGTALPLGAETVPVAQALGRVTAVPVRARLTVPHFLAAAMDGLAVASAATAGATERAPVRLLRGQSAWPVDTGDPLPPGADAVVPVEEVLGTPEEPVLTSAAAPGQHVRAVGEDMVAGDLILPSGHRVRPQDLGALLAGGVEALEVRRRPRVAVIPTGDELVPPSRAAQGLGPGELVESNSQVVVAFCLGLGAEPRAWPLQPDQVPAIRAAVAEALAWADLVLIGGGSSAGSGDHTLEVIQSLGRVLVRGLAIRPGKPTLLGLSQQGKPIVGLPGYPVSTYLACRLVVEPIILALLGAPSSGPERVRARLARAVASTAGVEELVRVKVARVGGRVVAVPLGRGAGATTSLVRADGWIRVGPESEGLGEGEEVEVELLLPWAELERTILLVGSHDLALDVLSDLAWSQAGLRLATANWGSLGGIAALARGEAHLAGSHLLDEASGDFNLPYLRRFWPGRRAALVTLAHREQGFIVPPGNPRGISSVSDLLRPGVRFINRQRGSGTRVLLDHLLHRAGLDPAGISGYGREEFTHTGVAAAIKAGSADVGLGLRAAALALGLDFVPVATERYELVVPEEFYCTEPAQALLRVLGGAEFAGRVAALGGYRLEETGRTRWSDEEA
ncbi:MAG: molybdopterin biosynthesis protein [Acetobacteraceae bacterium]|nr:molybdopterin biosynthesis protein [Acetobacteraceae bacterium]